MDFSLTREQEILRDTVREFAQRELAPKALALDEKGEYIHDIIKKTAELGMVGIITAMEYGGSGMGNLARMLMIEELSKVYASLGFFFQTGQIRERPNLLRLSLVPGSSWPWTKTRTLPYLN